MMVLALRLVLSHLSAKRRVGCCCWDDDCFHSHPPHRYHQCGLHLARVFMQRENMLGGISTDRLKGGHLPSPCLLADPAVGVWIALSFDNDNEETSFPIPGPSRLNTSPGPCASPCPCATSPGP